LSTSTSSSVENKIEAMKRKRLSKQHQPLTSVASPGAATIALLETSSQHLIQAKTTTRVNDIHNPISYLVDQAASVIGIGLDTADGETYGAGYSAMFHIEKKPLPPFAAYLDVIEEADWTLVMELGADGMFHFDSPYWTNNDTYPPEQNGNMQDAHGNAKYASFNTLRFSQMRLCVGFPQTNCIHASLSQTFESVSAMFATNTRIAEGVSLQEFNEVFDPWLLPACDPTYFGINVECPNGVLNQDGTPMVTDSSNAVRWGFCANRPSADIDCTRDQYTADAIIGMGLRARTDCCSAGAGYTNLFVYDKPNPLEPLSDSAYDLDNFPEFQVGNYTGHESADRAWLYIRPISPFPGMY